jgi:phage tail-like protein
MRNKFLANQQNKGNKMFTDQRKEPYSNLCYQVKVGGSVIAGFSEATIGNQLKKKDQVEVGGSVIAGLCHVPVQDSTTGTVNSKEDDSLTQMSMLPKFIKHRGVLLLKRGIIDKIALNNWNKQVAQGKMKDGRKMVAVILLDEKGKPVTRWEFTEASPSKYQASDLSAKGNEIAIETIDIMFESMVQTK